jgi:hypothetical protein
MTLHEVEASLPNGFHDCKIESILVNYPEASLCLELRLDVASSRAPDYKRARLEISGLHFCFADPPDSRYPFIPGGGLLNADGDPLISEDSPKFGELLATLPPGVFCYRFYIEQWNGFIYIGGREATLDWT